MQEMCIADLVQRQLHADCFSSFRHTAKGVMSHGMWKLIPIPGSIPHYGSRFLSRWANG
jgi:hypothetical protein